MHRGDCASKLVCVMATRRCSLSTTGIDLNALILQRREAIYKWYSIVFINVIVSLHCDCGRVCRGSNYFCACQGKMRLCPCGQCQFWYNSIIEPPYSHQNKFCFTHFFNLQIIQDYERGVVFRLGRLQSLKQPGRFLEQSRYLIALTVLELIDILFYFVRSDIYFAMC